MSDERLVVARRLRKWADSLEESLTKFPRWSDAKAANQFHRKAVANSVSYAFQSGWVQSPSALPVSMIADGKQGRLNWGGLRHALNLTHIEWLAEFDSDDPPARRVFTFAAPKRLSDDDQSAIEAPLPQPQHRSGQNGAECTDEEIRQWYAMQAMAWSTILKRLADRIEPPPADPEPADASEHIAARKPSSGSPERTKTRKKRGRPRLDNADLIAFADEYARGLEDGLWGNPTDMARVKGINPSTARRRIDRAEDARALNLDAADSARAQ